MKKILSTAISAIMLVTLMTSCGSNEKTSETTADTSSAVVSEETNADTNAETAAETAETDADTAETTEDTGKIINVASLKGPTTMGMVKLMQDNDNGSSKNKYNVSIYGTADEIVTGIVSATVDVANVPANLSSVLYNKTKGGVQVAAVNTLGVIYVVETGSEINSVADLKGKTIYSTGKGTTPEYILNYILKKNGIDPAKDVTVEFKSEATEVAAMLADSDNAIAVLPQPFVSVSMLQNDKIRICLDLTEEWNKVSENTLITGVLIGRKDFISDNASAFDTFLSEYNDSVKYVNENNEAAAELIEGYDIVKKGPAMKALPYCNITFLRNADMRTAVSEYLNVLFEQDAASVGGNLPDDNFYYESK